MAAATFGAAAATFGAALPVVDAGAGLALAAAASCAARGGFGWGSPAAPSGGGYGLPWLAPPMATVSRGFLLVRGSSTGSKDSQSAPRVIGTPAATSWPRAWFRLVAPGLPLRSRLMARCGRPFRMRPTRPVSTDPAPTSTKVRTPAAYIASMDSTKRTGCAIWLARSARIALASAGYGAASLLP